MDGKTRAYFKQEYFKRSRVARALDSLLLGFLLWFGYYQFFLWALPTSRGAVLLAVLAGCTTLSALLLWQSIRFDRFARTTRRRTAKRSASMAFGAAFRQRTDGRCGERRRAANGRAAGNRRLCWQNSRRQAGVLRRVFAPPHRKIVRFRPACRPPPGRPLGRRRTDGAIDRAAFRYGKKRAGTAYLPPDRPQRTPRFGKAFGAFAKGRGSCRRRRSARTNPCPPPPVPEEQLGAARRRAALCHGGCGAFSSFAARAL